MNVVAGLESPYDRAVRERLGTSADIDLLTIWKTLWRGRLVIGLAVLASVMLSAIYCFSIAEPRYGASSVLVLQQQDDPMVELSGLGQLPPLLIFRS